MRQNFIERKTQDGSRFISDKNVTCPLGVKVLSNDNLMSLSFSNNYKVNSETKKINSYEHRNYSSCDGSLAFRESIVVVADKKQRHTREDQLLGELDLRFNNEFDSVDYRMIDATGEQVIRSFTSKTKNKLISVISIGNEKYINISIDKELNKKVFRYRFNPITFKVKRNGFEFEMNIPLRFSGHMKAELFDNGRIKYFNPKGIQVSLASFLKEFELNGLDFVMNSVLKSVPKTSFFNTGNANARILEELRNAQAWITTGQDNLIRNLLEEYIAAVNKGEIVDSRPKKQ
jgi:hypothetical protein